MVRLLCAALLVLAAIFPACSRGPAPPPSARLFVIGLDGAEWNLIRPMMEAGEMPNFRRLVEEGVSGNLRSLEPPQKSPAIWTTIATGKSPDVHGIRTFVDQVDGRPLTQNIRQVRALWSIAGGVERTVGVLGWLMTWPAETVNGYVISDYMQFRPGRNLRIDHRTYPDDLAERIEDDVIYGEDIPWSFVQRFLDAPLDTVQLDPELDRLLQPVKWISAGDLTFTRLAQRMYPDAPPDFFAVYLRGMDMMGHLYWNYMTPDVVPPGRLEPQGLEYLSGAMRAYYRFTDELVGDLLELAEAADATVIVVSDHGFKGGPKGGVGMHTPDGILILHGPHIGRGEITGANVYDVTPTALVLMGLPEADDMPGKVLWSAFDETVPAERFQESIPTYEAAGGTGTDGPVASPVDEELLERLKALGYID